MRNGVIGILVAGGFILAYPSYGQPFDESGADLTIAEVAAHLAEQQEILVLPPEGTVKHSIDKEERTFAIEGAPSSAALFRLPDYQHPYVITVTSFRRGIGRTTELFIPHGRYLDTDFRDVGGFGEGRLVGREESVEVELLVDEAVQSARYLLLHTAGEHVGKQIMLEGQTALDDALVGLFQKGMFRVERSLEAKLEVTTEPRLGYPQVQEMEPGEIARFLVEQGNVVSLSFKGKVKPEIKEVTSTFMMLGGPSSVVLLRLPDYQEPYVMTIKSSVHRKKIFMPSGYFFDEAFRPFDEFGEGRLRGGRRLEAGFAVGEEGRDVRYLLLYTRGDLVGLTVQRPTGLSPTEPDYWVKRTLEARLEVEIEPETDPDLDRFKPLVHSRFTDLDHATISFAMASPVLVDALMWTAEDNGEGVTWSDAQTLCAGFVSADERDDWRVPTLDELERLHGVPNPKPVNIPAARVWSSEQTDAVSWAFDFETGERREDTKVLSGGARFAAFNDARVLCVRTP